MNLEDLRDAQAAFLKQISTVTNNRKEAHELRKRFVAYYTEDRIRDMDKFHYAIGNEQPDKGYNFCYTLERKLDVLGRIIGSTSAKFGLYYGRTKSDPEIKYRYTKKFGTNTEEAFDAIKQSLLDLIIAGKDGDLETLVKNPHSDMFKGKILSTYYPERYLNVFSDDHLQYYLVQLNLDTEKLYYSDPIIKREALLDFKNRDEIMKEWSTDNFAYFLYRVYPGAPVMKDGKLVPNRNLHGVIDFPWQPKPEFVDLAIAPLQVPSNRREPRGLPKENPDYEKEARWLKKLGDRGEKLVIDMEKKRLEALGLKHLADKVEKITSDAVGYDVRSYNEQGEGLCIEVKTTSNKLGMANFYLSSNELIKAKKLNNYFVYVVYDILSKNPKVWKLANPFNPEHEHVHLTPVNYRVQINNHGLGRET
ncbi:DUF3883 domain-containing protein [Aegicerativicinus sediminis]|uniref:DUF3883 domain-containing protein n=1 Tax=Aegicerativicinus sediminis TaxID=2893202 RepID=UPI001E36344B|nr:DUF3883 domain-containing protein [Aegicerativicinus sediminis]